MDKFTEEYLKEKNQERDEYIEKLAQKVLSQTCNSCGTNTLMRQGKTKFICTKCGRKYKINRKFIPKKPVDPSDQRNWKRRCDECGKMQKFYKSPNGRMAYICDYCGDCYEV